MANIIQGGDLMLFVTKGNKKVSIACATNHTLSVSAETSDTSHKDVGHGANGASWASSDIKQLSWEVTTENLFTLDGEGNQYSDLFDLMVNRAPIEVVFGPQAETSEEVATGGWTPKTTGVYTGKVIITSLQLNAPNGDNATYSATFSGVGALTHTA